jgi:GTP pyrophosphokinase
MKKPTLLKLVHAPAPETDAATALARTYYDEAALERALGAMAIVAELKLDGEALSAGLLAPAVRKDPKRLAEISDRCGKTVAELAAGVARMGQIRALSGAAPSSPPSDQESQLEALRKMLLAMVQDIRVVLVELAMHIQDLRDLVRSGSAESKRDTARLTHDLYAPLANRLGVWQLKWEMEDLALRILEPDIYKAIARKLDEKRVDRERYIESVIAQLKGELYRAGIAAEVHGRPKHIFSIYKKMHAKTLDFESLNDVRAVRVLVRDIKDCYAALGVIHNLWTPLPGEFDDYIAKPKSNHYRSLHTAVVGPEDKALEVQIRTHEMHQHSELGVAAHWRYKEGTRADQGYDRKIAWLRQILEWKGETANPGELAERFRSGLFEDAIYVLTPQDRVIALAKGSTPVDFAYHVHTELGHRCRGAKVDGAMVPLNTPLATGQHVEILAGRAGGPSRDWLNPALGYVRTAHARAKIRNWLNRQRPDAGAPQPAVRPVEVPAPAPKKPVRTGASRSVLVVGMDRLLTVRAKCCNPAPPGTIVGFITKRRGVTIHREDCASLKRLDARRRVSADWGGERPSR